MTDSPDHSSVLALLKGASIDPMVAVDIAEDVMAGCDDHAVERLLMEMDIGEDQAQEILEYLQTVLPGGEIVMEEIPVEDAIHITSAEMQAPGNPFVHHTRYFARRGHRVFDAVPYMNGKGEKHFLADGGFIAPEGIHQLWRTAAVKVTPTP